MPLRELTTALGARWNLVRGYAALKPDCIGRFATFPEGHTHRPPAHAGLFDTAGVSYSWGPGVQLAPRLGQLW